MNEKILLVDDEPDFLDVLSEFLMDEGYRVANARNGMEALDRLHREKFDLLISDINMPGMKGFELIKEAKRLYPGLKCALITAYDVREYLYMAKHYGIGNIITKTTPFNFEEVRLLITMILTEDVFGLDHYMHGRIHAMKIRSTVGIDDIIGKIVSEMPDLPHKRKFRQALTEIITNAVYYGARRERGDRKEEWPQVVDLAPDEEILVMWGVDEEKTGVAVRDQKGVLTKEEVLYWLERNTTKGEDGISVGLLDEHGKGLFISREILDRLIMNIKKGQKTEIVMLNYREGLYDGYKPLWIYEF
jgi:CheY-like chemotaxis protein